MRHAELWGAYYVLECGLEFGYKKVIIELDSNIVRDWPGRVQYVFRESNTHRG